MLVPFVLSRVIVVGAMYVARHIEPQKKGFASLLAWDAAWYRDIAHHGYDGVAREGLRFFPLFPLLGRALAVLPGVNAGAAIVIIANAAALVLGYVVYALAVHERADEELARRTVWLVYLVPPAYVLVMGYAEALFMVFAGIALVTMRSRRWWIASLAGLLAALTRPVGILLAVPALVELIRTRDKEGAAAVAAPVAGTAAYLAWAQHRAHDFFYPLRVQQDPVRRGHWVDPVRAVVDAVHELFSGDHVSAGMHAVTGIVMIGLLVVLFRRWPLSFALYATAASVVALSSRNLDSLERYALATIPFVVAGADLLANEARERVVMMLVVAGLVAASVLAFSGVLVP